MANNNKTDQALPSSKFGKLTVNRVMETSVRSEEGETSAELVASLLMEGFGSVPIVDRANRLIGIVSEFDLLNVIRQGKRLADIAVQDILTSNPISVTADTNMSTVIEVLQNNHLVRVPVVDSTGKLVGIVARRDIIRGYLHVNS